MTKAMHTAANSVWMTAPDSPRLGSGEVHVWLVATDDPHFERTHALLSRSEQERAAKFKFDVHRKRYVAAHAAVRQILSSYLQVAAATLQFIEGAQGKPQLVPTPDPAGLQFNLSHSHEAALIAVALARHIGVDIEYIKPAFDWEGIVENFFAPGEIARLKNLPTALQGPAFFTCWTRKESFIKAKGGGLSIPLHDFEVAVDPNEPAALLSCASDAREVQHWAMADLDAGPEYKAAVCVEAPLDTIKYWRWNFEPSRNTTRDA